MRRAGERGGATYFTIKISTPPPWRELEIPEGLGGFKDPGNSRGDGG